MALEADIYLDRIDILKYLSKKTCESSCGFPSCAEWLQAVKEGKAQIAQCRGISPHFVYALEAVISLENILPRVEITQHPVPGILGLHEINEASPESPVLVTGNALATQDVLMAVLSTTAAPFHLLFIDCHGHTVDMAMIYETFTPEKLLESIEKNDLPGRIKHRELILPGATSPLKDKMKARTGWDIRIGPYCAGELPLFMGEFWSPPPSRR